jgi:hypothetical protein
MTHIKWCSRFDYTDDGDDVSLVLLWPITPWERSVISVGGDIEAPSMRRASFIVRRDELLAFALRFMEDQWSDVEAFIRFAQSGATFTWYPDQDNLDLSFTVFLETPTVGSSFSLSAESVFPKLFTLSITLVNAGGVPYGQTFADLPAYYDRAPFSDDTIFVEHTLDIGLGPATSLAVTQPPVLNVAATYEGITMTMDSVVVNPAGLDGEPTKTFQRSAGQGLPGPTPLSLTFSSPIRGFQITVVQSEVAPDASGTRMKAYDALGALLIDVPFTSGVYNQSPITASFDLLTNVVSKIELYAQSTDWVAWKDMIISFMVPLS